MDEDCPQGRNGLAGVCLAPSGSAGPLCLAACAGDSDCAPAERCEEAEETGVAVCVRPPSPPRGQPHYDACELGSDCADPGDACLQVEGPELTWSVCSVPCAVDDDCPASAGGAGVCTSVDGASPPICLARCATAADCPEGFECPPGGGGRAVCTPTEST